MFSTSRDCRTSFGKFLKSLLLWASVWKKKRNQSIMAVFTVLHYWNKMWSVMFNFNRITWLSALLSSLHLKSGMQDTDLRWNSGEEQRLLCWSGSEGSCCWLEQWAAPYPDKFPIWGNSLRHHWPGYCKPDIYCISNVTISLMLARLKARNICRCLKLSEPFSVIKIICFQAWNMPGLGKYVAFDHHWSCMWIDGLCNIYLWWNNTCRPTSIARS